MTSTREQRLRGLCQSKGLYKDIKEQCILEGIFVSFTRICVLYVFGLYRYECVRKSGYLELLNKYLYICFLKHLTSISTQFST